MKKLIKIREKITNWIDVQNEIVSLKICSTYYRKLESGYPAYYFLNPRFYGYYLIRLLIMFFNLLRFNINYYQPTFIAIKTAASYSKSTPSNIIQGFKTFIYAFFGLRHFVKNDYEKAYYEQKIKDTEIRFITHTKPTISIIIPVYNQISYTKNCLKSILLNVSTKYSYEVIVIDDASTDETPSHLNQINGLHYIRNENNLGFLNSCNKAIQQAKGKFICLLNNDTLVLKNWLESMASTIEEGQSVGCVGSKLIYPYGLLQEAGGIIFSDGSGINYGKYQHIDEGKFNYKRSVDYCSGASLLFLKADFEAIGEFDTRFAPAYYEDTDFCFAIRHLLNKKVIYQPASVLVHFEGISSGKKAVKGNVKSYQNINREKFIEKWSNNLNQSYPICNADKAAKKYFKRTITVIDSYLPFYDRESGSNRLFQLLKIFLELGYHVIFIPHDGKKVEPYHTLLTSKLGIEVVYRFIGKKQFKQRIKNAASQSKILWICRPNLNRTYQYLSLIYPHIKWIYDTIDLHFIRIERAFQHKKEDQKLRTQANYFKTLEVQLAKKATLTIAITNEEAEILKKEGAKNVEVIPNVHKTECGEHSSLNFNQRKGILFIGGYDHEPNVDAAKWLVEEIMPIVWQTNPTIPLILLGSNPTEEILALKSNRITVPGFIDDVSSYFETSRLFVAPLRYGAGMKGKIGQSLSFGLPIVSTPIGTEGMDLIDGVNVLEARDKSDFANKILLLYNNQALWNNIFSHSQDVILNYSPAVIQKKIETIFTKLEC